VTGVLGAAGPCRVPALLRRVARHGPGGAAGAWWRPEAAVADEGFRRADRRGAGRRGVKAIAGTLTAAAARCRAG
jgi:hypothetical protein